jgi:hypothetical protein
MTAPAVKRSARISAVRLSLQEVAGKQQVLVDHADFQVAMVHALDAQGPAFLNVIVT